MAKEVEPVKQMICDNCTYAKFPTSQKNDMITVYCTRKGQFDVNPSYAEYFQCDERIERPTTVSNDGDPAPNMTILLKCGAALDVFDPKIENSNDALECLVKLQRDENGYYIDKKTHWMIHGIDIAAIRYIPVSER